VYCSLSSRPSAYSVRSSSDPAGARRQRRAPTRGLPARYRFRATSPAAAHADARPRAC
jgi:hypothetical protein